MDTNELIERLRENEQQLTDSLTACMNDPACDPRLMALILSKIQPVLQELLDAQEQVFRALGHMDDRQPSHDR